MMTLLGNEILTKRNFFYKLFKLLNLNNELSAEERLDLYIMNQKHKTLLERIEDIRTNSTFVPDYNKPKLYTDVKITYKEFDKEIPISYNTKDIERPIDFKGDIKAWMKIIKLDHKKDLKEKELKKLKDLQRKQVFEETIAPYFMNKMMKIN